MPMVATLFFSLDAGSSSSCLLKCVLPSGSSCCLHNSHISVAVVVVLPALLSSTASVAAAPVMAVTVFLIADVVTTATSRTVRVAMFANKAGVPLLAVVWYGMAMEAGTVPRAGVVAPAALAVGAGVEAAGHRAQMEGSISVVVAEGTVAAPEALRVVPRGQSPSPGRQSRTSPCIGHDFPPVASLDTTRDLLSLGSHAAVHRLIEYAQSISNVVAVVVVAALERVMHL